MIFAEPLHTQTTRYASWPASGRWRHPTIAALFALGLTLALLGGLQPARAASFVVTKTEDTGDGPGSSIRRDQIFRGGVA